METDKIFRKIKLKLSLSEMQSLAITIQRYIADNLPDADLGTRAHIYRAHKLYEGKLRNKLLARQERCKLNLNVSEADTLFEVLAITDFAEYAVFEQTLGRRLLGEIDRQVL